MPNGRTPLRSTFVPNPHRIEIEAVPLQFGTASHGRVAVNEKARQCLVFRRMFPCPQQGVAVAGVGRGRVDPRMNEEALPVVDKVGKAAMRSKCSRGISKIFFTP